MLFYVTEGLVERGDPSIPRVPSAGSVLGRDGKFYGITELTQSALAIPFYWTGKWLSGFFPQIFNAFFTRFAVSFFSVPITALTAVVLLVFGRRLGYPKKTSLFLAIAFAVATIAWPYATMFFRAAAQTLGLLVSIFAVFLYKKTGKAWWLVVGGCAFGLTSSLKVMTVLALPGILLYLWLVAGNKYDRTRLMRFVSTALEFGIAALPWALIYLGYNYYRFGGWLDTGYSSVPSATRFDTPLYLGLYGYLLSPGRSIFVYSPPILLAIFSAKSFWKRYRDEAWLIGAVCLLNILVYATFHAWHGESSWGPRYLVPLIPLLVLPIGAWLEEGTVQRFKRFAFSPRQGVFWILVILGTVVQISAVSLYFNDYYTRTMAVLPVHVDESATAGPQYMSEFHFNPEYSPVIGHWRYIWPYAGSLWQSDVPEGSSESLAHQIALESPYFPIDPVEMQVYFYLKANSLDFWWVHWRTAVSPTIRAAEAGNLAGWIGQCTVPAPPLGTDVSLRRLHIQPLRRIFFDCTQSWFYPELGDTSGWYALHNRLWDGDVAFLESHLENTALEFVNETDNAIGPAFRMHSFRSPVDLPALSTTVQVAPLGLDLEQTQVKRQTVAAPLTIEGPLDFLGYRLLDVNDDAVVAETWWKVTATTTRPLSIMAHLIDVDGTAVAVADGLGVPVDGWQVGDTLVQYHDFLLPAADKRHSLWLQAGIYWLDTLERHIISGPEQVTGDRILLEEIQLPADP